MKGIILAGGRGTRLLPLTNLTNKHLLPIFNKAMIEYPLNTLLKAGIREIMIISSREHAGDFIKYLGSGSNYDARFSYRVQDEAGGIAHALAIAEDFASGKSITVILGDNIFGGNFKNKLGTFKKGARIFLKKVDDPQRFGVPDLDGSLVKKIIEKPENPPSPYAVTGLYQYDSEVFKIIKKLKPSNRGEFEITDVNNSYIRKGQMKAEFVNGLWSDAGTFDSLAYVTNWAIQKVQKSQKIRLKRLSK